MGSPINIGRVFGVYLRIDIGVFLLAAFFVLNGLRRPGMGGVFDELTFVVLFIFSIYLHEMGHALAGRLFGIGTLDVTLTFFGGFARLSRPPRTTLEEIVVSGGGPAANLAIFAVLTYFVLPGFDLDEHSYSILGRLAFSNLALAIFNLLPGYPLDGGKIACAILAKFVRRPRARVITGYIGVGVGFLLIALDLQSGSFSFNAMVGVLLILAASQEIQSANNSRF
ncbi:MAG: site-2 protease family protein [Micropepsaceae bacterium]